MATKSAGPRVAFYGFDRFGFDLPTAHLTLKNGAEIHFLPFNDARRFEEFDGVVVPQGIFENLEQVNGYSKYVKVLVAQDPLLERERQLHNLIREKKWICFLVGPIVDEVAGGHYQMRRIYETDLCKRVLNGIGLVPMYRKLKGTGMTGVTSPQNEFQDYVKQHGIAQTWFELPYDHSPRILAKSGSAVVGMDYGSILFLPFHTTKKNETALSALGKLLGQSILDYRQKQRDEVPDWAQEFQFETEQALRAELDATLKKADELQVKCEAWQGYKAVLATSGDIFKEKVIFVLEQFFGFKVDPLDEGREDAKLLDDKKDVLALIEAKGTKGGVRREHVTQTDTHRDRNDLPTTVSGVLIINCQMDVPSIEKRVATTVDDEHVKYASQNNVLIIRTTELLMLMRQLEKSADRKAPFLKLLAEGGGLLKVTEKAYEVVKK